MRVRICNCMIFEICFNLQIQKRTVVTTTICGSTDNWKLRLKLGHTSLPRGYAPAHKFAASLWKFPQVGSRQNKVLLSKVFKQPHC